MLSILIGFPLLGALLLIITPPARTKLVALVISGAMLLWTLMLFSQFDLGISQFQMVTTLPWLPVIGLNYDLGLDGLSLLMVSLNTLLTWIAIYSARADIKRPKLFYSLMLITSSIISGTFLAKNFLLFFLFYEASLIPLYLLISIWGGEKRNYAATKFLIYTALSGAFVLVSGFGLLWLGNADSFSYEALAAANLPVRLQTLLLIPLAIGFGIKMPMVPLHTWLPDTYVAAATPVAIMLGGVLAKLGTYGLLRFGLSLLPEGWAAISPWIAGWAAITIIYCAFLAIVQKDVKRMVAYSSVSHMGYILLGISAATSLSISGCIAQMIAHGLVLAILFHLIGVIETKVGSRDLDQLNGLMNPVRGLPFTSATLLLGAMASAGIPGLVNFAAEFALFLGSYRVFPVQTLVGIVGIGLTAVYFVILLNRTCFGRLDNQRAYFPKVSLSEKTPALILAVLIIVLGVQPNWLMRWTEPTEVIPVAVVSSATDISADISVEFTSTLE
ncbi:NADH-quinone oxidoreductase subunit M [Leptolyngbya cf. ectocarpi LEGE 11479]|uniref:NADH-quinone oxidoreductase subunit M n=1 Tax=Leptolyngbya cf. ectocarpi LEGE 11479 TaxID=1828722 RepID=A0A928WYN2_LEPEC|nr:NADH-quinone oxidoreductase subunit M [Leptolyngbya ectocarpi]MBE9065880.1 NADH-quinone oxidoreductase subunit M [Leptolyngbya cf. ectocarpi LEGE 11479]